MSNLSKSNEFQELYFTQRVQFSGYNSKLEHANYVLFGIPHDKTTCYRPGTRDGPLYVREASLNIETFSNFSNRDISEVKIHDLGDLSITGNQMNCLDQIETVLKQIRTWKKIPIMLGGEHSITIPIRNFIDKDSIVIIFDAHGDLREEYLDEPYSHACITKRLLDVINPSQILQVGIRAQSLEEIEFVNKNSELLQITTLDLNRNGLDWAKSVFKNAIKKYDKIYVSIDIDGFDPSFAPGTGTPETMGLNPFEVFTLLHLIPNNKIIGIDLVEVNPNQDHSGITSILAAKTLFELLLTK